jgi:hypothetical protein
VEVDDEYAALGDPYKLLRFGSCNLCADLREERRGIYERIARCLTWLQVAGDSKIVRESCSGLLVIHTKRLTKLIAKWYAVPNLPWEECLVEQIMSNPAKASVVFGFMWKTGREFQKPLL